MQHTCKRIDYCICDMWADTPKEDCPIHGNPTWPPRCMHCGQFMKYPLQAILDTEVEPITLTIQ